MGQLFRGVIFDIDNTLVATNAFIIKNISAAVERVNALGKEQTALDETELNRILAQNPPFEDIFKKLFTGVVGERPAWEVILENYRAHAAEIPYQATTGAVEAVQALVNQGVLVALVTNRVKMVEERLKQAGFTLEHFFSICQPASSELAKPDPRSLDKVLAAFKERGIAPEQIAMVGDHPHDCVPATFHSVAFVAVLQGLATRADFEALGVFPTLIIDALDVLPGALLKASEVATYKRSLWNSSAVDGRHALTVTGLADYFSEFALHKNRIRVEIEHVIALSEFFNGQVVRVLTGEEKVLLRKLYTHFSRSDAFEVLQYDHLGRQGKGPTEHDVKSCELWIGEKITTTSLKDVIPSLHLFVTSEDINNLAYKLMLAEARDTYFLPKVLSVCDQLHKLASEYAATPIMGRTHLQPASPTTFGKIFAGYLVRLTKGLRRLDAVMFTGKCNGATGNYNAFVAAYPNLKWLDYSSELMRRFGFATELWSDQRGPHVDMVQAFQAVQEVGNVIRDLAIDLSLYAAFGVMYFAKIESHVGSSVMPHKINPWWAEVAEGNIKKANYLINGLSNELDVSRLQRDLSDHDLERSYGEALGYVVVAVEHITTALGLLRVNAEVAQKELDKNPQIIGEALQTIMRVHGVPDAYELIKKGLRGTAVTLESLQEMILSLPVAPEVQEKMLVMLKPSGYTGLAPQLTELAMAYYKAYRNTK